MKKRIIAVFLAAFILAASFLVFKTDSDAYAGGGDLVRVKLAFTDSAPKSLTVTIGNNYYCANNGSNLSAGTYTFTLSGTNVNISGNGYNFSTASPFMLIRGDKKPSSNLISLAGLKYGNRKYLGDMYFYCNSGSLMAVNRLSMEEYLYGTVSHEMADSYPKEALKAQAVVARGYAKGRLKSTGTYDIGDTADDQVYFGYDPATVNTIAAVDETAGEVLTYNGKIAATFYYASNGGQTEYVGNGFGGGSAKNALYPYLTQKDDPYDLENPASRKQVIYVPKQVEGSKYDAVTVETAMAKIVNVNTSCNVRSGPGTSYSKLGTAPLNQLYRLIGKVNSWYMIDYNGATGYVSSSYIATVSAGRYAYSNSVLTDIQKKTFDSLIKKGYQISSATDIKIKSVASFKNTKERWPGTGSRCYTEATALIYFSYCGTDGLVRDYGYSETVTINLMNKTSSGSIAYSHEYLDSTLWMRGVEETADGFNVVCRRYGHGIGMSQRGAQQMAGVHGWSYKQILDFYYPGTKISSIYTVDPEPTPTPTPTPTPAPAEKPTLKSSVYKIDAAGSKVTGISPNTSVSSLLKGVTATGGGTAAVYNSSDIKKTAGNVATGDKIYVFDSNGNYSFNYKAIIYGDVNSDGDITVLDLLRLQRYLLGTAQLSEQAKLAADVNKDGEIAVLDLLRLQRYLLNTADITQ